MGGFRSACSSSTRTPCDDPLHAEVVKEGSWEKDWLWSGRADFGNPDGAAHDYEKGEKLTLVPLGTFFLWSSQP